MAEKRGFLLVLMQPPPAFEEEFNAWYDTEHIPERLSVPGIDTGLRFVCISGHPRYLAMYDLVRPEVMSSPDYLKVAHERASPWTKRVTSRVRVYRSTGQQVWPGHVVTQPCARALLLRFRGLTTAAERDLVAGMRANFEDRPLVNQSRLLASPTPSGMDYLGFVEARAPLTEPLNLATFGAHGAALDLVNTYAPY